MQAPSVCFICRHYSSQVLEELLRKLKVEHVVWCRDKENMYYEVRQSNANYFHFLLPSGFIPLER